MRSSCLLNRKPSPVQAAGPQQCSEKIEEDKSRKIYAHQPGQGWRRGIKSGNKLADEQGARAEPGEGGFGLAHAGVGFERDPAEQVQYYRAAALTKEVPEGVTAQGSQRRNEHRQRQMHAALSGEGASGQQERDRGNGQTTLLDQHPDKEQGIPVMHYEFERFFHEIQGRARDLVGCGLAGKVPQAAGRSDLATGALRTRSP